jgi:glycosyltransferase involved in cell wall biosynthesis
MKAAIYNPYLDTLGGGERYTLSFARVLLDMGYEVDIEWRSPEIIKLLEDRFGLDLSRINVVSDIKRGDGYDLCFWVSDGSIPALKSRKNFLHFQVPFHDVNGISLINRMKFFRVNKVICNSAFTKQIIDKEYGVDSVVVYPPVDTISIRPKRKENIILFVGRFSELLQNKNQDVLIKNFKKLVDLGLNDWKLILAGGVEVGAGSYLEGIKKMSRDYPVEIIQSPNYRILKDLYGKAKIFWSASGFGADENKNPEKVEHFGITVVEAMTAGAVPVVFNAGGHKEIITVNKDGFLWDKESELLKLSKILINNKGILRSMSRFAMSVSSKFSYERFKSNIEKIL